MIGIIYKFTILTSRRFYVGQHEAETVEEFLVSKPSLYSCYWGSGSAIWEHVLNKHIAQYPTNWNKLIKREILLVMNSYSPKSLNKMERYWIKKAKAHYSYKLGGCNFLWGEARGDDWVNAMKIPEIRAKVSAKNRISLKGKLAGDKHWNYGKHRPKEVREKISKAHKGKRLSENTKMILSEIRKGKTKSESHRKKIGDAQRGEKSVHFGKHLSKEQRDKISKQMTKLIWINNGLECKRICGEIPEGWAKGRLKR